MPVLSNPRHERFAQAVFACLGEQGFTQAKAYERAGCFKGKGHSAEVVASRLLKKVEPIMARVRELQEQAARKQGRTVEAIVDRMALASRIAEEDRNPTALTGAESAIAKILGLSVERHEHGSPGAFENAGSTIELADALLRDANPGIASISEEQRAMALGELARHAEAMAAIAHGAAEQAH